MLEFPTKTINYIKRLLQNQQKEVEENLEEVEKDDPAKSASLAESSEPGTDSYIADVHTKTLVLGDTLKKTWPKKYPGAKWISQHWDIDKPMLKQVGVYQKNGTLIGSVASASQRLRYFGHACEKFSETESSAVIEKFVSLTSLNYSRHYELDTRHLKGLGLLKLENGHLSRLL